MNDERPTGIPDLSMKALPEAPALSLGQAKARLLAWSQDSGSDRGGGSLSIGTLATRGALVVMGGMLVGRVLFGRRAARGPAVLVRKAGTRWLTWALAARVGQWLLPYAISAVQKNMNGQRRHEGGVSPARGAPRATPASIRRPQ